MSRDWRLYLEDMVDAIGRARRFIRKSERERFLPGDMVFEATVRQLEILGEAASHIPEAVRLQAPTIPWANLSGIRNRLIHGYFSADPDIVWNVVQVKLPGLEEQLNALIAMLTPKP